jgi:hypothetical protein
MLEAVIVENRFDVGYVIDAHKPFLPEDTIFTVEKSNVKSILDYNKLMTSLDFWQRRKTKKVLIFQHDSALLRKGIERFYEYDYVGAPWGFQEHGGNGGLSLRSVDSMIWCIKQKPWISRLGNEDVYFSNMLKDSNYKLAPREVCEEFSVESIYKEGALGYHAIEKYLTPQQVLKIKFQYYE